MDKYKSTAQHRRVWPSIQRPDGSTLELDPGETAELDLPKGFKDPALEVVEKKLTKKQQEEQDKKDQEEKEKAAADAEAETAADKENQS